MYPFIYDPLTNSWFVKNCLQVDFIYPAVVGDITINQPAYVCKIAQLTGNTWSDITGYIATALGIAKPADIILSYSSFNGTDVFLFYKHTITTVPAKYGIIQITGVTPTLFVHENTKADETTLDIWCFNNLVWVTQSDGLHSFDSTGTNVNDYFDTLTNHLVRLLYKNATGMYIVVVDANPLWYLYMVSKAYWYNIPLDVFDESVPMETTGLGSPSLPLYVIDGIADNYLAIQTDKLINIKKLFNWVVL
jgi:hypothetical protein